MPKRTDINTILVIGSGPIVIGQACEFDYSGAQACKVLKEEGYRVVLVNSNPATIMTDPDLVDRTYVEPITCEFIEKIIEREKPDALLATLGGQTALNAAVELAESGILDKHNVELIGCDLAAIQKGENRKLFNEAMAEIGVETARGDYAYSVDQALAIASSIGYPVILRPSFTLGGAGGGAASNPEELARIVSQGLELSPIGEVLVEESIMGWKEYEMEVMRDGAGNGIIVCSIENLDPMGVHTGDSITVAPAQTLSDIEYQRMRVASLAILEKIGVETGGSNVQFAINPENGRMIVIEMNPRVSRSSALASKATGFPIAKAAAKLAVGYTLDEIVNDITRVTPACFEPSIDYCVVKVPRFAFEKFQGADDTLTTRMKAVGEVMAIGRTFEEALAKALRSLEDGHIGLAPTRKEAAVYAQMSDAQLEAEIARPSAERIFHVAEGFRRGLDAAHIHELSGIDPFFLGCIADMVRMQENLRDLNLEDLDTQALRLLKQEGMSDALIAELTGATEETVRACRKILGVLPAFKTVDTCAAEFASTTSYHYKTYDAAETELAPKERKRIIILGAGPNRIGQGIEFDYCCVQASYALAADGYETIMINCNPETVSTDYDTSDMLFFEPLTFEDVMDVVEAVDPDGVILTLGGQTPLKLASALQAAGVPIIGTTPASIDLAEDRDLFSNILDELEISYPAAGMASTYEQACRVAEHIGFPLLVRPSYVLGGRGMAIVYDANQLETYMTQAAQISPDHPIYLDKFLEGAIEVDLDALCDGTDVYIGGVMEHIEMAGIHSGDSACVIPPYSLSEGIVNTLQDIAAKLALRLGVKGLLNIQFAIKDQVVYVIEANPRASRTVPFVSKATGVPLAKAAARIMAGEKLARLGLPAHKTDPDYYCVKEAVMPWGRFPGARVILGPEMKSTGEVMGIAPTVPAAYAKTQFAIDYAMPEGGLAFVSVNDGDKRAIVSLIRDVERMGFGIVATQGTAKVLRASGIDCLEVSKIHEADAADGEGERPSALDLIRDGKISLIINTPFGTATRSDGYEIRSAAVRHGICHTTTLAGAQAMIAGME
ncbi:MAG: carbamoyl-phosphate synthase large subunit, partial [Eggerthellaceae bacterium]|nr:carbamoyl-phosphate synthase large subunit [Eggerthellaceae bacterium]